MRFPLLPASVEPTWSALSPLVEEPGEPGVAGSGSFGLHSTGGGGGAACWSTEASEVPPEAGCAAAREHATVRQMTASVADECPLRPFTTKQRGADGMPR